MIIFIHGMESDHRVFDRMAHQLDEALDADMFVLRYPNDGSLARSGKLLARAIGRYFEQPQQLDFVCHSAGGLVFRWYSEVERLSFRRAVMLGTPHHGSNVAGLRALLETRQLLGDVRLGYTEALERTLLDAKGEVGFDLQPESLFLRFLNRDRPGTRALRARYTVVRGRALNRGTAFAIKASFLAGRLALARTIERWEGPRLLQREALRHVERLVLPDEVTDGDLAVTLASAELEGVPHVETLPIDHIRLPRHPEAITLVEKSLALPRK